MKKILALVLALTLVFGTFSFAAAAPADVVGTDYEESVERLSGLGVISGYPDGTYKPENTITRAEFAVVVVKLLGLADAAQYANGDTGFYDVPADHWASGYVNIAVNRGIIMGYPDGSFGPNNPVSYAEAVTMLVRVLGYGPAADDEGTWPANYIAKSAELGVTDGVNFYGGSAATRGNIALMADNSLEVPMMVRVGYGDEATYQVPKGDDEETLLNSKIKAKTVNGFLTGTYYSHPTELDADEIYILDEWDDDADEWDENSETVYDVAEDCDIDFSEYFYEEVTMWMNNDDEVFFIERETSSKNLVYGVLDGWDDDDWEVTIVLEDDDDEDYELASTVSAFVNFQPAGSDVVSDNDDFVGMHVKAVIEDGEIATLVFTNWTVGVVDEVDEEDEEIDFKDVVSNDTFEKFDGDLELEDMEYDLDLGDLEEDMLVYWYSVLVDDKDDVYKFFFEVYEGSEVGELEEYKTEDYVVVDGEEYDLAYTLVGDNAFADITDLLGDEVEIFFGKDGKVAMIELDTAADEEKDYALVVDISLDPDKYGNETAYIKLLTAADEVVEYEISEEAIITFDADGDGEIDDTDPAEYVDWDDDDAIDASIPDELTFGATGITIAENTKKGDPAYNAGAPTLVKYALDRDGMIDELEVVGEVDSMQFDKDRERLGTGLFFEDDTLIFDAHNEEVITMSKLDDDFEYDFKYVVDDADLDVIVIYSDNYVEDTEYAIYLSKSDIADGEYKVKVMVNGEEESFNTDDCADVFDDVYKGKVFSVDFTDGKISDATAVTADAKKFTSIVVSVSTSKNRIELSGGQFFMFADEVQVYEYTLKDGDGEEEVDEVEAGALRDIEEDQLVNIILDEDDNVEYVYIIDDDVTKAPSCPDELVF